MSAHRRRIRPTRRRRGVLTLELVLLLPILLIVILAMVELATWLIACQAVGAAASIGARVATMPEASTDDVQHAVGRVAANWNFAGALDPVRIDPSDPAMAQTGDMVTVTVSVDAVEAVPNLLKFVGLSISDKKITGSYVMRKE